MVKFKASDLMVESEIKRKEAMASLDEQKTLVTQKQACDVLLQLSKNGFGVDVEPSDLVLGVLNSGKVPAFANN
jgi:hypothetical protein